ncbi:MAG: amino acid adenylation domain-containing protein, partial [Crocinitomicaceae bacterium]
MSHLHLSQKEIYFDQLLDLDSPVYNIGTYVVIKGNLNVNLLKEAIQTSADRFDVFKFGSFSEKSPEPSFIDVIEPIKITELDYSGAEWTQERVEDWLKDRINEPFDIYNEKLYDFLLIKRNENESWLYIGCHHLFSDGYGVPYVLLKYIFDAYHHLKTDSELVFSAPSYLDLIDKSNAYLNSDSYTAYKEYWRERFEAVQAPIIQGGDNVHSALTDAVQLRFSKEEQISLREFCRDHKISLQDFLVALLTVYYTRVKKTQTFDFCLATHNRTSRKERQVLGAFSKLLPNRLSIDNPTLKDLFDQIRALQRSDYRHKEFPVSHFRQLLQNEKNPSSPFDICVNYRYFRLNTIESELELKGMRNDASYAQTPIEFSWCDFAENGQEDLFLEITFRTDCFSKPELTFLKDRIRFLIDQFYHSLETPVNELEILPKAERNQLIFELNQHEVLVSVDKTVVDLFEEQVMLTPEQTASVFVGNETKSTFTKMSYSELSRLSNDFAAFLVDEYELKSGELVGIRLGRNEFLVAALLGVLKSGGVYVPIDPKFPKERIDFIEDQCKCSIGEEEVNTFLEKRSVNSNVKVTIKTKPSDLAYVIFTSGSTGTPKGVMISHQSLVNKLVEERTILPIEGDITSICLTNFTFDVSLLEVFLPLLSGGKVVNVTTDYITDVDKCALEIIRHQVNLLQGTPTFFNHFIRSLSQDKREALNDQLEVICIGGESLTASLVSSVKAVLPSVVLNNHYGPTEITIDAIVEPNVVSFESNIIGKPLGNTKVYILADEFTPTPFFEEGEIFIAGPSVAEGYLNENQLSDKAFLKNPFVGGKMYRTGDLAKVLDSGEIVFLGRKDEQVKVRGYRIELEEIEHVLASRENISECAVITVGENENKQLHAYFTAKSKESFEEIRKFLSEKLPSYMIPRAFVQLDEMPLTNNGKLDKKALTASTGTKLIGEDGYLAPSTEMERKVARIWEDILDLERIGTNDDFFAIGGHSLQAVRLNNAYQKEFGADLELKDIFQHPILSSHVELIESSKRNELFLIPAIIDDSDKRENVTQVQQFPISDAQRRLWVLSQFKEASVAYNMAGSVDLDGEFDPDLMQKAFELLIERHEVLRTVFRIDEKDEIKQWVYGADQFEWKLDLSDARSESDSEEYTNQFIATDSLKPFDLEKGPLFRACLFQLDHARFRLYFNIHHIISDGWSLDVLEKDLFSFYSYLKGENQRIAASDVLPPLRIQYKDYAVWQSAMLKDGSFEEHKAYWLNEFSGGARHFDLPTYTQRPKLKTYQGKALSTFISKEFTHKLDVFSRSEGVSTFTTLMAIWNVLFYRYSLQNEITIGTSSAGRMHPDLENQIGFYVNTLAIKNTIDPSNSFTEFLQGVKTKVLEAFTNQMYPFDRLVEELDL